MRNGLGRGLVPVFLLAAVTAAILLIGYVIRGPGELGQRTALAAALIGIVGAVSPAVVWAWRHRRPSVQASTPAQADAAADLLAIRTASTWSKELVRRGIHAPAPVRVRWGWAPDDVALPRLDLTASPSLSTDPDPLPSGGGTGSGSPAVLSSGVVTRLHNELYARLRHGRLVLIGGPGAGKTGAMMLLLAEALRHRGETPGPDRAAVPVPVWLTLGSWNPTAQDLRAWVVATMARDNPYLRAAEFGPDAIGALFDTGRIALFLDGLDEMPDGHRNRVFDRLAAETAGLRVTLSSRPDQYRTALGAGRSLPNTAVVKLHPVGPQAATRYLLEGQLGPARDAWRQVTYRLQAEPDSVLTRTLSTPLTLSLARSAYAAADPTELLAADLDSETALRGHLLDQVVIAAYPDARDRARVGYWLGWIADQMNTHPAGPTRDLRWWDISTWAERRSSQLVGALAGGMVLALGLRLSLWWLVSSDSDSIVWLLPPVAVGLFIGPLAGLVIATAVGRLAGFTRSTRARRRPRSSGSGRVTVLGGLLFGLPAGLAALTILYDTAPAGFPEILMFVGYVLFVASLPGLLFGLTVGRSPRAAPRSMILRRPTRQDARSGRRLILASGLPIGLPVSAVLGLTFGGTILESYDWYHYDYDADGNRVPVDQIPPGLPPEPSWPILWIGFGVLVLVLGYGVALLAGILFWLVGDVWHRPLATAADVTPRSVHRKDAQARLISAFLYGIVAGLVAWFTIALAMIAIGTIELGVTYEGGLLLAAAQTGLVGGVLIGPVFGIVGALRDSAAPILLCTELGCLLRGRPVRFLRLLEEARERQILRQAGAVYQFRHADLQDQLAEHYGQSRNPQPVTSTA